ncbi:hypothetical protein DB346_05415 [Verrucomicrobia bacterium LW23]|nr:hypothetical protein DB346_05415 [Verrucomicrobia bacterium LW23]
MYSIPEQKPVDAYAKDGYIHIRQDEENDYPSIIKVLPQNYPILLKMLERAYNDIGTENEYITEEKEGDQV